MNKDDENADWIAGLSYWPSPYGTFTCKSCYTTFEKSREGHGASGYCTQCEIGLGFIKIHATEEENFREQIRTRSMINQYVAAFIGKKL